ncbi:hypothetical protein DPMN_007585 [Dreissena polymorpha]|uniref:Uncharacterized protein n=1 Tax=Dreissena polymorpha TaxID=45954 RepID=A0A9D4MUL1_DREPO|nr:hypothetical protein DPMN_007585 [Dreissena polymorpha]
MIRQKKKTAPPTGSHVFQWIGTTFKLNQDIIKTNILTNFIGTKHLTKFYEDRTNNVASRVLTSKFIKAHLSNQCGGFAQLRGKTAPLPTAMNVLSKFHENWAKNVTSTVEKCPAHWRPCFSPITTIFKIVRDINKTNVLTNFHDDLAKIVTLRVFTRKTAPLTGSHVFQRIGTTFELNQDIIKTNILTNFELSLDFIKTKLLTKFYEDGARNVASIVFTSKCLPDGRTYDGQRTVTKAHLSNQLKTPDMECRTDGRTDKGNDFHEDWTMNVTFGVLKSPVGVNLLTKFHEDQTINVASRVLTSLIMKKCPASWGTYIRKNLLTKFHDEVASLVKNFPNPCWPCFLTDRNHFNLIQDIIKTTVLTKNNSPPPGGHVFQPTGAISKLILDIASRVLKSTNIPPPGGHVFTGN